MNPIEFAVVTNYTTTNQDVMDTFKSFNFGRISSVESTDTENRYIVKYETMLYNDFYYQLDSLYDPNQSVALTKKMDDGTSMFLRCYKL